MMKRCILGLAVAPMAFSAAVFAVDCNNPPGGTDLTSAQANYQCAEKDRIAADAKLNRVYKRLTGFLKDNAEQETMPKTQIVAACYGSGYLSVGGGRLSRVRQERFPELVREHRETPQA